MKELYFIYILLFLVYLIGSRILNKKEMGKNLRFKKLIVYVGFGLIYLTGLTIGLGFMPGAAIAAGLFASTFLLSGKKEVETYFKSVFIVLQIISLGILLFLIGYSVVFY